MNNFISVENSVTDRLNNKLTYLDTNELAKKELIGYKNNLDLFHRGELGETKTTDQGDLLEDFFEHLFKNIRALKYLRNVRTGSNEIDVFIKLTREGRQLRANEIIPSWFPDSMLIECKNYTSRVGVTYVNKFKSVIDLSSTNFGSFISYKGLAGQDKSGWQDAHGLIYKYGLMHLANEKKPLILNISNNEINRLVDLDFDFFEWIEEIYIKTLTDIRVDFQ